MHQEDCSFCDELDTGAMAVSTGPTDARIEWLDAEWALAPSLGPVSPLHLVLLPRTHSTFSLGIESAPSLIKALSDALIPHTPFDHEVLLFEHANSPTGCGVLHAHVHAVTVRRGFEGARIFGGAPAQHLESLASLAGERRELSWCCYGAGFVCATVNARIPSQTARRAVAGANQVVFDTDWRTYTHRPWFDSSRAVARDVAAVLRRSTWRARPAA